jgi:hypothetical protein
LNTRPSSNAFARGRRAGNQSHAPATFARQIEFIQKSGIVTAMVGLLQAIPGIKLYQRLNAQGRLTGQTTGNNLDGTTNFIPRMNRETLREGYRNLMGNPNPGRRK